MKRSLIVLFIAVTAFLIILQLSYCTPSNFKEKVKVTTIQKKVGRKSKTNADTISIIVTNKYSEDIFIGEDYYIAKFNGKKWVRLPLHYAFVDIGYKIPKGESKSFTINLQKERYKYSRGQYKIVKPFSFSTNEMKDSMMYYFSIKKVHIKSV